MRPPTTVRLSVVLVGGYWAGAEGQSRTGDTGIFSAVLYHLSYLGEDFMVIEANLTVKPNVSSFVHIQK